MLSSDWTSYPNGRVRARVLNRVAWMELRHPPANNYSYEMMRDLDAAILAARMDDGVDVLVLSGDGDRFFCSGADIRMLSSVTPRFKYYFCLHANETLLRLGNTAKLTIAALNGHCVGGGLEVALACDLRLARRAALSDKEFKLGLPEVNLGVLPGTGGTQRLARLLGAARALELMAEGTLMSPDEARACGLVHKVLDFAGFREAVQSYAERFTAPHKASFAVGAIKRAVHGGSGLPLEAGLALERELQQQLFTSRDAREGLTAFEEKRKPSFEGS
ncbi:MAG: enoyl-CoA hydratase/isomerase family protein [Planctomycetota bacterium]|nr:MAG: enoyl-CoA hydratase/isomerase family protein [Planctomycetota bacterium]